MFSPFPWNSRFRSWPVYEKTFSKIQRLFKLDLVTPTNLFVIIESVRTCKNLSVRLNEYTYEPRHKPA